MEYRANKKLIGIIGGMGPIAGINLSEKIINQTLAAKDQDHLSQILYSAPQNIADRTEFILGAVSENPAYAIFSILKKLELLGVTVAGIACNSAHAPAIFNVITEKLSKSKMRMKLLNMIEEIAKTIMQEYKGAKKIGLMATRGTVKAGQYNLLKKFGLNVIYPEKAVQDKIHQAIYHPDYGIKSFPSGISVKARHDLEQAASSLINNKAEIIVLGCTELPLVFKTNSFRGIPLIDSNLVLARALIRAVDPSRLKPWKQNSSFKND